MLSGLYERRAAVSGMILPDTAVFVSLGICAASNDRVYTKCASKHNYSAAGRSAQVKAAGKQVEIASNGRVYTKCASKHNYPAAGRRARVKAAGKQVEIASNGRVYTKCASKHNYSAAGRSAQKKIT